jgi:hypothetical protein
MQNIDWMRSLMTSCLVSKEVSDAIVYAKSNRAAGRDARTPTFVTGLMDAHLRRPALESANEQRVKQGLPKWERLE